MAVAVLGSRKGRSVDGDARLQLLEPIEDHSEFLCLRFSLLDRQEPLAVDRNIEQFVTTAHTLRYGPLNKRTGFPRLKVRALFSTYSKVLYADAPRDTSFPSTDAHPAGWDTTAGPCAYVLIDAPSEVSKEWRSRELVDQSDNSRSLKGCAVG